jgi:hypothetical protein
MAVLKMPDPDPPKAVRADRMTRKISEMIRPYSSEVAPESSERKRRSLVTAPSLGG